MGQDEILKLLKKKRKWMNSKEIKSCLKEGKNSVTRICNILLKSGEIERKAKRDKWYWEYSWRYKK